MKFAAIADWAEAGEFPIDFMCKELGVSRGGYYKWLHRGVSDRQDQDALLIALIKSIYAHLRGSPGVRRVRAELAVRGHRIAHKRVARLMRATGLQGRHPRRYKRTTIPGPDTAPAPDLIGQSFVAAAPDQKWCGDISYIWTWQGWAYLATVIDLHSRAVVGWAIADHMRTELVTEALQMAITHRNPPRGVIFHSDRGTQYTSRQFARFCNKHRIRRSMGRTGTCFDNAVAESFFATYKKELIHTKPWSSIKHLRKETFTWTEEYYNRTRRHSTLGYLTPAEYELGYRYIHELAA